jgi:serine protease AprX
MGMMIANWMKVCLRRSIIAAVLALAGTLIPAPAHAEHHARLSADLADHLNAGSQTIDVIVHGDAASVAAVARRYNLRVKKSLKEGAVLSVNAGQLDALRRDDTQDHLSGDIRIRSIADVTADVTAQAIGADQVWAGSDDLPALTGSGVAVAVIDSGIDTSHNAFLRNRVIATHDFTGGDGIDGFGHGTHVAGIIAGRRGRTAETREYRGIASGAYLINLRVLGDDGSGVASDVIEAIDWTIEHQQEYKIRVINLSLGAPVMQPYRDDPLCEAVERAVKAGITVVVAAGNFGRTKEGRSVYGAITTPGNSPHALTVGAIDTHGTPERSDDTLAPYSSKGPTRYDLILKPDLSAPGSHIVSAEGVGTYLSKTYPERHVAGSGADAYMQLSGTSMAAGVVSGAVALLLEDRSELKPIDVKAALQLTSTFIRAAGLVGAGTGEINVVAAIAYVDEGTLRTTSIADESLAPSGITSVKSTRSTIVRHAIPIIWSGFANVGAEAIVWSSIAGEGAEAIVWSSIAGEGAEAIVWSSIASVVGEGAESIVWSSVAGEGAEAIVWSSVVREGAEAIVWSSVAGDGAEAIVWSSVADGGAESIVWSS